MLVLVVNCANGRIVWARIHRGDNRPWVWICARDNFQIVAPQTLSDLDTTITQIVEHSRGLAGTVQSFQQVAF